MSLTDTLQIHLVYNRSHFNELYFSEKYQDSYFLNKTAKTSFLLTLLFFLIALVVFFLELSTGRYVGLLLLVTAPFLFAAGAFFKNLLHYRDWRQGIDTYLDSIEKYQHYVLTVTPSCLSLRSDEIETILRWETVQDAQLNDQYLQLNSTENFLFPKKSMTVEEYALLRDFISERLKHPTLLKGE